MMLEFEKFVNSYVYGLRTQTDEKLASAIAYALNGGGKRVRPKLMLLTSEVIGLSKSLIMPFALAIECIHTYSLIHDDLPAMDNDNFRRGRLTVHKAYDYATAILAGDALLNAAFEVVLNQSKEIPNLIRAASTLASASGARGMVGGQARELSKSCHTTSELLEIYSKKTGALISASIVIPCQICNINENELALFEEIGNTTGLIFQLVDDILDMEKELGLGKLTFATLMGSENTESFIKEKTEYLHRLFSKSKYNCSCLIRYIEELTYRSV